MGLAVFETNACHPYGQEHLCDLSAEDPNPVMLNAGTEYLILANTSSQSIPLTDPQITIEEVVVQPGEVCETAVDISVEPMPFQLAGSFEHDSALGTSCNNHPTNAVWLSYTPATTGWYQLHIDNHGSGDPQVDLAVFEGTSCAPFGTELRCLDLPGSSANTLIHLDGGTSYLILFHTDRSFWEMRDPEIDISSALLPPVPGDSCEASATVSSSNHFLGSSGEDCWSFLAEATDQEADHSFYCDTGVGGDVVIAYTTGPTQTTLSFDALASAYGSSDHIAFEITDGPCDGGTSLTCSSSGDQAVGNVSVEPSSTYYIFIGNGYGDHHRPNIEVCLSGRQWLGLLPRLVSCHAAWGSRTQRDLRGSLGSFMASVFPGSVRLRWCGAVAL